MKYGFFRDQHLRVTIVARPFRRMSLVARMAAALGLAS